VILYGDTITSQMQGAIDETARRRAIQAAYNEAHNITPRSIQKAIRNGIDLELKARRTAREAIHADGNEDTYAQEELMERYEQDMLEAADNLEFERAAELRDRIADLKAGGQGEARPTKKQRPGQARSRSGTSRGRGRK
jgi:excinuclease ABC subunit B